MSLWLQLNYCQRERIFLCMDHVCIDRLSVDGDSWSGILIL